MPSYGLVIPGSRRFIIPEARMAMSPSPQSTASSTAGNPDVAAYRQSVSPLECVWSFAATATPKMRDISASVTISHALTTALREGAVTAGGAAGTASVAAGFFDVPQDARVAINRRV